LLGYWLGKKMAFRRAILIDRKWNGKENEMNQDEKGEKYEL
jgi:hypothetical protein